MAFTIPDRLVPPLLRVARFNHIFVSEENARDHVANLAARPAAYGPPAWFRDDVTVVAERRAGWPIYRISPKAREPRGCVVYAHGGGWVNEIHPEHWRLIGSIAARAGVTVVVPIYPLVPFGTAEVVIGEMVELVRECRAEFGTVALAGDSAGGQISLSTALELRDRYAETLPLTVLISPALDLSWSNPEIPEVQPDDPWLAVPGAQYFSELWRGDLPVTDQRVSPVTADLSGLGRLLVFAGTFDILSPDARLLIRRAREARVPFDFYEAAGQVHVYPFIPTNTGRQARRALIDRLSGVCRGEAG